jgi:hypothetical protein
MTSLTRLVLASVVMLASGACRDRTPQPEPTATAAPTTTVGVKNDDPEALRERALASAHVWRAPSVPVAQAVLGENPGGASSFKETDEVSCRFVKKKVGGRTPKFNCELPSGEVVKVKYGTANAEVHAEVAATRLLAALGFGADHMFVVRKVRCAGCPALPFPALKCFGETHLDSVCFPGGLDYEKTVEFDPVVIERRLEGRVIEGHEDQGWAWFELDRVSADRGGSPRAEVDALKLMAVFLAHWDNKAENQRLVCLPGGDRPNGSCARPFALIQDLGSTFGPAKVDLHNWRNTPVWTDRASCRVSMARLPFEGATFRDQQISEDGRRLLVSLLEQLSPSQLTDLFTRSRITTFDTVSLENRRADAWVAAFQEKVRELKEAGPCPAAASTTSSGG